MARCQRRNHSPIFKAQVAVAALKDDKPLTKLAQHFDIHPSLIADWKSQFLERVAQVFGEAGPKPGPGPDIELPHAKNGQLIKRFKRLWHSVKHAGVFLRTHDSVSGVKACPRRYFDFHNGRRAHQSLGGHAA